MPLLIGGKSIAGPKKKTLVIPRDEGPIVFNFIAVNDATEFEKLCPDPTPPRKSVTGQGIVVDYKDKSYREKVQAQNVLRTNWYFLTSTAPSDIKWEQVKMDRPETWHLWREELSTAGFSGGEIAKIFEYFENTNILSEEMIEEARKSFLAEQQEPV